MNFQEQLLNKILGRFDKKADAVEAMSRILQIGKDGIYRRIRGVTMLSPEEVKKLCIHFKQSADSLIYEKTNTVFFSYNGFNEKLHYIDHFLDGVREKMQQALDLPDCHLYYASSEIPIFHYMYFPELISFKLYVWGLTSWNLEAPQTHPFHFELIPFPTLRITESILELYNQIPSSEICILGIVQDTLNQIEFVSSSGRFKKTNDAILLCDRLLELNNHLKGMAEAGRKFLPDHKTGNAGAAFELYHNQLVYTSNTLLAKSSVGKFMFTAFANPNYLVTYEERMCNYAEKWLQQVIRQSNPLSTHSTKNREAFFSGLEKKIQLTRHRIETLLQISE